MYLEPVFSTPIWSEQLNLDLPSLERYAYNLQEKDSGRVISNHGGWQSSDIFEFDNTPIEPLINNIRKLLKVCFQTLEVPNIPVIDNAWVNINPPGSFNKPHIHGNNCFLAVVFYVKASNDSGSIFFDRGSLQEYILSNFVPDGRNTFNSSRWQYQSKENQVIIFPSWISHSVGVNESDSDRISIALNVKI
jgi:uncharacterized protein (TIGR02466 family)